ncbi:MAG: methyltransferase domain-containing protein [Candidatus Latescibacteria bacterium]|nr:methyltransferase domain-containing protein [Candidatus Latescibacterota bacterium]
MSFLKRLKKIHVEPYSRIAEIYDAVMRHVNYPQWADYIESLFRRHAPVVPVNLLDVACGTGTLACELTLRGYSVVGVDASETMIQQARVKAVRQGVNGHFTRLRMTDLGDLGQFDAILCLYDSINYLCVPEDVEATLLNIYRLLRSDGLFIFDICTERNSLLYFRDWTERERTDRAEYVRHSSYDPKTRTQTNRFDIHFTGEEATIVETHRQRIYAEKELRRFIARTSFTVVAAYDGFSFNPASEETSDRIHFVLQK